MSPDWMAQAACKGMDTNIFFPERGGDVGKARAICARCPVSNHCLIYAYTQPDEVLGVWGGTSANERARNPRIKTRSGPVSTAGHGTNAGYSRHLRSGSQACRDCLTAHAVYVSSRKRLVSA